MAEKIESLIKDVYVADIQKKNLQLECRQAEINALQSQIDPHFLFNTLESIRMRSVLKKEEETADIIKYLSKIFRRILLWGNDMTIIKEEIEFIEDFLTIQKYRFGNKLNYNIYFSEEVLRYKIPKMTVQPFIENACIHGVEKSKGNALVSLYVEKTGDNIRFIIEDNGKGIGEGKIDEIISNLQGGETRSGSVGMKNVYNRLSLIYGDKFAFQISSKKNIGTKISLSIPAEE